MTQEKNGMRSRLPLSQSGKKLVHMRLNENENLKLELLAEKENRSKSAMARLIFLTGLKYFSDQEK